MPDETRLRVLMLAPTPYFSDRGCHVRIYEEARIIMELGHDVRILTYHIGRDMPGIPTIRIPSIPWYKKLTAGPSWHKPYLDVLLFFRAIPVFATFKPDLIHAHLHEGAFLAVFLKMVHRLPILFDCQGSLTGELLDHGFIKKGSILYRLFSALEQFINARADMIIASSSKGVAHLITEGGVPANKVAALIDGVDTDLFRPLPRDAARAQLGLQGGAPLIAYLGLMNSYQGIDLLLEAIVQLRDRRVECRFLLMGYPEQTYARKARRLGIDHLILFTGKIDYALAPVYLAAADLAVSPKISLTEANGKLFNYMAAGLATAVFETPVNREILGDAGLYARLGDAADLAAKIELLVTDAELRQQLSARARNRAVSEHSWRSRGQALLGVYRALLKD